MSDSETNSEFKEKSEILTRYADRINTENLKQPKITKDKANRATVENVLDPRTMKFLVKLFHNGLITKINGCISTGKEANVYHGVNEDTGKQFAIKIYKTSILVFKDRERYVDGEFRFRNSRNQHNPRKMIKVWAEKEFRNLKRLYLNGVPSPEPVDLKSHVLAMEFLTNGDGWPSPKLRDYNFSSMDEIIKFYYKALLCMRKMFHVCRLIHADLSEYNTIVHKEELYIFDVSQSVEPEHPMSLDFLRMDIKNMNDFFSSKKKINVIPERLIFNFVVGHFDNEEQVLASLPLKDEDSKDDEAEDEVFRMTHLVRSLNHLEERDFVKFQEGKISSVGNLVEESESEEESLSEEEESDSESDAESADSSEDGWEDRPKVLQGKKHEDKDAKRERKKEAKENAKEKRKTKMKKHVKKKMINKSKK